MFNTYKGGENLTKITNLAKITNQQARETKMKEKKIS